MSSQSTMPLDAEQLRNPEIDDLPSSYNRTIIDVHLVPNRTKKATVKDVARLAGVSPITVSRVLNYAENVSSETRTKVSKAISKLQFFPNPHAAALGRGRRGNQEAALAGSSREEPLYSDADAQNLLLQAQRLRLLEGGYSRVRRAVSKLNKELERLKSMIQ